MRLLGVIRAITFASVVACAGAVATWRAPSLRVASPTRESDGALSVHQLRTFPQVNAADWLGAPSAVAVFVLEHAACLVCQVELSAWRSFSLSHPSVQVVFVVSGDDIALARQLAREERLPFPVLLDREGRLVRQFSHVGVGTLRLLQVNGRTELVTAGTNGDSETGDGFLQRVSAVAKESLRAKNGKPRQASAGQ